MRLHRRLHAYQAIIMCGLMPPEVEPIAANLWQANRQLCLLLTAFYGTKRFDPKFAPAFFRHFPAATRALCGFAFFAVLQQTILVIIIHESEVRMTDMTIDEMIEDVIEREGGYVNHPADKGGPTRWGITGAVARRQGYMDDMRQLPQSDAAAIYKRLYWIAPAFDKVAEAAPMLAAELFDTGINMGTGTATGFLQRALNALNRNGSDYGDIVVDRRVGPATLLALGALLRKRGKSGEDVLLKAIEALQGAHYVRLAETRPAQEAFLYGWLANRIG
jgi:lysozyme family protein